MTRLYPFLIALQFLTRIPVRLPEIHDPRTIAASLSYYPLVGLILGGVLAALNGLLVDLAAPVRATLVLSTWVALTGALHLDGLADSADAWIGGGGNRERTLTIMQDTHCGAAAVVTLVLALLLKLAALQALASNHWMALVLIPMLARAAVPLLFVTTPYVRPGGLGTALAENRFRLMPLAPVIAAAAAVIAVLGPHGAWLSLALGGVFVALRRAMLRRIGGTTGDTAGALIEIGEIAMLLVLVLLQSVS